MTPPISHSTLGKKNMHNSITKQTTISTGLRTHYQQLRKTVKLKVVMVMMFSSLTGMLIVPNALKQPSKILSGIIGISLAAFASAALNHLFDKDEDKKMKRTQNRPLAQDPLSPWAVKIFAISNILLSLVILWGCNNRLCSILTLATTIGYSLIYTKWLKPSTPQNIVIGGLSGAMPPLLGWTSLIENISYEPLVLVLIIFSWTPAHFWPLAIAHKNDYAKTKWPMLPITHGITFTKLSIIAYALLTTAATLLPFSLHMTGHLYLICASLINLRWLYLSLKLWKNTQKAIPLFKFSIYYILAIFLILIIDYAPTTHHV